MNRPPEQSIVDYLEASGYGSDAIIAYLEASANAGRLEFAEGEYDNLDFAVCERPDGTRYGTAGSCNPETGKEVTGEAKEGETAKPGEKKKQEKPDKTLEELKQEKMKKTAEKQGSDPTNNRKVMIDGKGYGWAQRGGKWVLVEWGSVAGIKRVGPKQSAPKRNNRVGSRGGSRNESGYVQGLRSALEKQTNDAGREAIMDLIRDAGATV